MTCLNKPQHDEIVRRLVVGELDEHAEEARSILSQCEDCKQRISELRETVELLDAAAREEEATLKATTQLSSSPGEKGVDLSIRRLAAQATPARPRTRVLKLFLAASLAAAVLIVAFLLTRDSLRSERPEFPLGGREFPHGTPKILCVAPAGEVAEYGSFSWKFTLKSEGWFDISIWDDSGGQLPRKLVSAERLTEPTFTPSQNDLSAFPRAIFWEVVARDATGKPVGYGSERASLSSR